MIRPRRQRLDTLLVARGLACSRNQAQRLILAGQVRVDGSIAAKPGSLIVTGSSLNVKQPLPFVSRGGEKLAAALKQTGIEPRDRICMDVGASTGGFTDCLLQQGARYVVAVDVGYGQLDWRLRGNPRVGVLERTNARYLSKESLPPELPQPPDLLVMDLAFIGIGKVLPAAGAVCDASCDALVLVKPQFECGQHQVEAGGVVRAASNRRHAVSGVAKAATRLGWSIVQAVPSPLRGPAGNWECFLALQRPPCGNTDRRLRQLAKLEIPDDRAGRSPDPFGSETTIPPF